jgi:putative addiction module component (TIGR02574 family)
MSLRDRVLEQALKLNRDDRVFLIDALERSLPADGFSTPEIASAWTAEIDRRIAAFDKRGVDGQDAREALNRIREMLKRRPH